VSKTCNVSPDMPWAEFKDLYMNAWRAGAKGITTFQTKGKRAGILVEKPKDDTPAEEEEPAQACYIDPTTGRRECQ
jgi:ribonucleoside-diphosphate reductase alpha chain